MIKPHFLMLILNVIFGNQVSVGSQRARDLKNSCVK